MEKQLSELEGQASMITGQWLSWLSDGKRGKPIPIPKINREVVSLYIAVQYLRTADTREILCALDKEKVAGRAERTRLHTTRLWDLQIVHSIRDWINQSIWVFGRNDTDTPFITSDNPVTFRTPDNKQWLRLGVLAPGMYVVFALSPSLVMYCYERSYWGAITKFDRCLSAVILNTGMVKSENTGQVFMASRFVFSRTDNFTDAHDFARSIGREDCFALPDG